MANEHNNKRPTAASMLNIAAFCTALFAVGGLSIAMEKPTYSEQEKRDLAKMPELTLKGYWNGSLASGIDAFYSDTFPLPGCADFPGQYPGGNAWAASG